MSDLEYVYETFIKASPERVWQGLTSAEFTRRYFWKTSVESTWKAAVGLGVFVPTPTAPTS